MAYRPKSKQKKPLVTTLGQAPKDACPSAQVDLSQVHQSIATSVTGLTQILNVFNCATQEIKDYLRFECDVLYECRICRNIFRSLANFILHKRNFCKNKFTFLCAQDVSGSVVTIDKDSVTKKSPKKNPLETPTSSEGSKSVESNKSATNKKTLSPIIQELLQKQTDLQKSNESLSEKSNEVDCQPGTSVDDDVICISDGNNVVLETIDTSDKAKFQTLIKGNMNGNKWEHAADLIDALMKKEVLEIHDKIDGVNVVMDSNGNVHQSDQSTSESAHLKCTECQSTFSTRKTLAYHMKYKHSTTSIVYPCPNCQDTFTNAWSVYRHLYKVHKLNSTQVKRLRSQVHSSGIARDQQPVEKRASKTYTIPQKGNEEDEWMEQLENDAFLQMCGGCGRKFERRAALQSHSQMCHKRLNVNKENARAKRAALEEEKKAEKQPEVARGAAKRKASLLPVRKFHNEPVIVEGNIDATVANSNEDTSDKEADQEQTSIPNEVRSDGGSESPSKKMILRQRVKQANISKQEPAETQKVGLKMKVKLKENPFSFISRQMRKHEQRKAMKAATASKNSSKQVTNKKYSNSRDIGKRQKINNDNIVTNNIVYRLPSTSIHVTGETITHPRDSEATLGSEKQQCGGSETANSCENAIADDEAIEVRLHTGTNEKENNQTEPTVKPKLTSNKSEKRKAQASLSKLDLVYLYSHEKKETICNSEGIVEVIGEEQLTVSSEANSNDLENDDGVVTVGNNIMELIISDDDSTSSGTLIPSAAPVTTSSCESTSISAPPKLLTCFGNEFNKPSFLDTGAQVSTSRLSDSLASLQPDYRKCLNDDLDMQFFKRASPYMDLDGIKCIPCECIFKSHQAFVIHMAQHFSWFRYQCTKCSYMSFDKWVCKSHAHIKHGSPLTQMDMTVLPIPDWKVFDMTHHFKNNLPNVGAKRVRNPEDTSTRKMPRLEPMFDIREKIEIDLTTQDGEEKKPMASSSNWNGETDNVDSRPIRNRVRSVKTLDDDFIYDLGKGLRFHDNLFKNKGKKGQDSDKK